MKFCFAPTHINFFTRVTSKKQLKLLLLKECNKSYCICSRKFCLLNFLFLIHCFVQPVLLLSQPSSFRFEHLNTIDGLSHNKVQCILQDRQGYIWFGTVYGLNRYDGYAFKVFENIPGDSSSIANNNIISLYQDKDDIIWIGASTSTLSSYNPRTESFRNYALPMLGGYIHDVKEDEQGLLWLATGSGLFSLDKRNNSITHHATTNSAYDNIHSILKDKNPDIFWLSTENGIKKFNKRSGRFESFELPFQAFGDISREITHNIIKDRYGNFWMSTSDRGVHCWNPQNEKFTRFTVSSVNAFSFDRKATTQIMEDNDGKIWIGGEGLAVFDPLSQARTFYKIDQADPEGIPGKIRALLKDRSGIYWLGTERGIAKYDPKLYSFITVKLNYPFTLQSTNTLIEDKDHKFWVGNYSGLGSINPSTGFYTNENTVLDTKETPYLFSSLLDKDGSIWFGGKSCLFHVFKKSSVNPKVSLKSDLISLPAEGKFNVTTLTLDQDNILWAGTKGGGLFRYNPSLKTFKSYVSKEIDGQMLLSNTIKSLHAISADSLLIATVGSGLILMHSKAEKFERIKFEKNSSTEIDYSIINAICEDSKKNIWIGTENGGLWQTNVSLSKFTNYSTKDGLQAMTITQIVEDERGQIWLNTSRGLDIIDPVKKRVVHYSEKDGLSINQFDYLIKKASGDILRIDLNGLHIFRSSSININKQLPPVYINYLKVLDKTIPIYNDTSIQLAYNQNYITFSYVALNYTQSYKNRYAFRLEGLNEEWIDAGDERSTTYAHIAPGTYTFRVKACNNNGLWNETGASVTLIITPPWWQTWLFYVLSLVTVTAAIYALSRYRLQERLKALEVRNTISRDLHDEVGSTLSSIGFLSSMALNDVDYNNAKAQSTLQSISESSTKMLDAMNDIIWNIQPENDTLENIIARMRSFSSEILEARKILLHYTVDDNLKHLRLGVAVRHDFFVIYKEAVNNLAKYSAATEANINLKFRHPFLILTIADNGKGFDPKTIRRGNGLKNMRCRSEKMGAFYDLNSVPGKGTTITLKIKLG